MTGQCDIALNDGLLERVVTLFGAQPLELGVQIENHGGIAKSPRLSARVWMKAHNKEPASADAHAEMRGFRIGVDAWIPWISFSVDPMNAGEALPEMGLKVDLTHEWIILKHDGLADENLLRIAMSLSEVLQYGGDLSVIAALANVASDEHVELVSPQRCFCANAREIGVADEGSQLLFRIFHVV